MSDHVCRCEVENAHPTWGACARWKNVGSIGVYATRSVGAGRGDAMAQKKWDRELNAYAAARKEGIQPAGTQRRQVEKAVRLSNDAGRAFDAGAGGFVK